MTSRGGSYDIDRNQGIGVFGLLPCVRIVHVSVIAFQKAVADPHVLGAYRCDRYHGCGVRVRNLKGEEMKNNESVMVNNLFDTLQEAIEGAFSDVSDDIRISVRDDEYNPPEYALWKKIDIDDGLKNIEVVCAHRDGEPSLQSLVFVKGNDHDTLVGCPRMSTEEEVRVMVDTVAGYFGKPQCLEPVGRLQVA